MTSGDLVSAVKHLHSAECALLGILNLLSDQSRSLPGARLGVFKVPGTLQV